MIYMEEKFIKRGYNFGENLLKVWENFHRPSKDYSPSAAGAFLVWMTLPPEIREQARQAACCQDIDHQIRKIKEILEKYYPPKGENVIVKLLDEQTSQLLAEFRKSVGPEQTAKRKAKSG